MPEWKDRFEQQQDEFRALVKRTSDEELRNALKFGRLTMSSWKGSIAAGELQRRAILRSMKPDEPRPEPPAPKTAWDRVLDDDSV